MKYQSILESWQKFLKEEKIKPKHIGIVGDSQIKGSVGRALEKYFKEQGYHITRIGKVGAGAKGFRKLADTLKGRKFDHIIISSGGNDAWRRIPSKNWQELVSNHYIPLFKQLKQLSPNVHWFGPAPNLRRKTNSQRVNFSKALEILSKKHGIKYTAMNDLWNNLKSRGIPIKKGPKGAFRDSLHYGGRGAEEYAKTIAERWLRPESWDPESGTKFEDYMLDIVVGEDPEYAGIRQPDPINKAPLKLPPVQETDIEKGQSK